MDAQLPKMTRGEQARERLRARLVRENSGVSLSEYIVRLDFERHRYLRRRQHNLAAFLSYLEVTSGTPLETAAQRKWLRELIADWVPILGLSPPLQVYDAARILADRNMHAAARKLVNAWLRTGKNIKGRYADLSTPNFWLLRLYLELTIKVKPAALLRTASGLSSQVKMPVLDASLLIETLKQMERGVDTDFYCQYLLSRCLWTRLAEAKELSGWTNQPAEEMCIRVMRTFRREMGVGLDPGLRRVIEAG